MSRRELLALPVAVDLLTAARAFGIGRSSAYELVARDEFPVPVLRVGRQYRVTRTSLLAVLGISDDDASGSRLNRDPAGGPQVA